LFHLVGINSFEYMTVLFTCMRVKSLQDLQIL